MTDPAQLEKENQILREKIDQLKQEIDDPKDIDIESFKVEDFEITKNDLPEIKQIKKDIINEYSIYDGLSTNFKYLSKQLKSKCKEKKINSDELGDIEAEFQQIDVIIEKTEKELFFKIAKDRFQTSKRSQGKIKSLLREDIDMRNRKLKAMEELRTKREQITKFKFFLKDKDDNKAHPKDDADAIDYKNIEEFINSKNSTSVQSHQKLLELKKKIETIQYYQSLPEEIQTDKSHEQNKNHVIEIYNDQREFEIARRMNSRDDLAEYLNKLVESKKDSNKKRIDYYNMCIESFRQEMNFYIKNYQLSIDSKEATISNLKEFSKKLKKFKERMDLKQKKMNEVNSYLENEYQIFQKCTDIAKIKKIIDLINDEYKMSLEQNKKLKYIHQGEINKICYILNIPLMSLNESPKCVYQRILNAVNKLQKTSTKNKDEDHTKVLEKAITRLKQPSKHLKKILNDSS